MKEYLFDVKLFAQVRVKAKDAQEARKKLATAVETIRSKSKAVESIAPDDDVYPSGGELIEVNGNYVA